MLRAFVWAIRFQALGESRVIATFMWVEFDPTNRITAGSALIRVATTRTPAQASPVSGSYDGTEASFLGLSVSVDVREVDSPD